MLKIKNLSGNLTEVVDNEQESIMGGYTQAELNRASQGLRISAPSPTPYLVPILPPSSPSFDSAIRSTTFMFGDRQGNTGSFGPGGFSFRNPSGTGIDVGPGGFGGSFGFKF